MKQFSLEEYLEHPDRKVVTRDGRSVRIICTDRNGLNVKPITALITIPNGDEIIKTCWKDGVETRGVEDNPYDLFFATEKKNGWLHVYKDDEYERGCHFSGVFLIPKRKRWNIYRLGILMLIRLKLNGKNNIKEFELWVSLFYS